MVRTASLSWFTPPVKESSNSLEKQLEAFGPTLTGSRHARPSISAEPLQQKKAPVVKLAFRILGLGALAACVSFFNNSSQWRSPTAISSCNPFAEPGVLFLNVENTSSTRWQPFDDKCPPSHLLPLVEAILESDAIDPTKALPWMVNRTIVLIGDSIERFSLDYFCEIMEGELSLIDPTHPFSPPPFRNGRDELRENEETVRTWVADGRPHWCRISQDGLNLNILSFFMYGSAQYEEFELQKSVFARPHYYAPVELKARLDHWVRGTLQRAGLTADIVQFSSCLWDVMHWSEIDSVAAMSQDVVHAPFSSPDRLEWYRNRLSASLDSIEQTFPRASLVWRRGHEVPCGQFHVPCARNSQFNSVANDVIARRSDRWAVDETGAMIRGHSEFYKDKVHPGKVFSGLWTDIMLHRLMKTYLEKRQNK